MSLSQKQEMSAALTTDGATPAPRRCKRMKRQWVLMTEEENEGKESILDTVVCDGCGNTYILLPTEEDEDEEEASSQEDVPSTALLPVVHGSPSFHFA